MQPVTVAEIARVTGGQVIVGNGAAKITGVKTDSRQLTAGDLFVALPGERTDGHAFVSSALAGAAEAALVSQVAAYSCPAGKAIILVPDTGQALLTLGAWYRGLFSVRTVGITGSTGKTTVKDLTAHVLASQFLTLKNLGNLNTEVGLPLTLFNLESKHRLAVLELAMRGPGQIHELAQVAQPEVGVITNVGVAHIELLGSQENIAQAKGELLECLPENGLAVLNGDDPQVRSQAARARCPVVYFGLSEDVDFKASEIQTAGTAGLSFTVTGLCGEGRIQLPLVGQFNVLNALPAIAVGHYFGLSFAEMSAALSSVKPAAMRLNIIECPDKTLIIDDVYNANPVSMRGALRTLADLAQGRREVAILGDMMELGKFGPKAHEEIGKLAVQEGVDCLIAGGSLAQFIAQGAIGAGLNPDRVLTCPDACAVAEVAGKQVLPGDAVLVKASRGMQFEQVVAALQQERRLGSSC